MDFVAVVDEVIALLRQRGRVAYRTLKRQFQLDDEALEDLKIELIDSQRVAIDEQGTVLIWTSEAVSPPAPAVAPAPTSVPLGYTPPYLAEKILTSRSALEGERKQVTVLFADLKGSMELLADRDPEEARQLLDPVLERMMAAVHRYEGTVNQVMGDGIMALFGAPLAHEDHAVRACYAALAMQEAIRCYSNDTRSVHGIEVQIRVGLHSGEVVVRAIGNDLHMDYSAIGQTTHLAARMEQLAPPGSIRLTADTLHLAEGLVQVTPLGPVPVKGLSTPVEVCELVGAGPARTRLQAFAARGLTPFVGRQAELVALHQALEQAEAGHGQVVAVLGEPGMGKSRLFHEFTRASRTQGWRLLASSATSYGTATPYLPVLDLLKTYFHVEDRDDGQRIREKLTGRRLTLDPTLGPTVPAFLALLEVPMDDPSWQALDPAQRRQRTLDALKHLLLQESQVQPLLLVCENLHWIDTETQAFLNGLVESLPAARVLLLINYRPEYQHSWGTKTYYTQLRLDPLPPASTAAMLQSLLGDDAGLEPLQQRVIARTEGNPFFLEESVRTLVETQVLVGAQGAYRLSRALPSIQVPATVQAVLAARLDRLPPEEKQLLQTAAVIGTEVPLALLQAMAEVPEEALQRSLAHVQAAEFLYETRLFPEHAYTFKHALTHEVAYRSLLKERRQAQHARIVEVLETLAGDRRAEQVEHLVHHALRGEVWDKAVIYCQQAGARAHYRGAFREAVTAFEHALQALVHLPEDHDSQRLAITLRLALVGALAVLGEFGRRLTLLREAEVLARALDDWPRLVEALARIGQVHRQVGDNDSAMTVGREALDLATRRGNGAAQVLAAYFLGQTYYDIGAFGQAAELQRWNVEMADRESGTPSTYLRSQARSRLAQTLGTLGVFAEGRRHGEEALRLATLTGRGQPLFQAYFYLGDLYHTQGNLAYAIQMLEQALALCRASSNRIDLQGIVTALGSAYALQGRLAQARTLLGEGRSGQSQDHKQNSRLFAQLSEVCRLEGHGEEAWQHARRALDLARQQKVRGNEAQVLYHLGVVYAHATPPDTTQAAAHYQQALALAEELGMRPLQAHCHHGLGTLYAKQGRQEQARTALSTAIALYRAMEMRLWLPQAEATLGEVADV